MPPPNPFEPPGAAIAPASAPPRSGSPPPGWGLLRGLAVAGLGCGVPLNLFAAILTAILWYVQVRAGHHPPDDYHGLGVFAVYLFAAASLGVVAMRAWSAGRWRLAFGTTLGFVLLFPLPMMIALWNLATS